MKMTLGFPVSFLLFQKRYKNWEIEISQFIHKIKIQSNRKSILISDRI